ncbi:hypothetical protein CEK29_00440 [Bordetella genomosp. 5]|uniref:Glycine zipper 2TM domain-containing protein n=1 Tax=Bordetella genomosp. 5 TaxID=1395608 RepID=A0A261TZS9_9BORD|nr:glycine zipper 2TM domain-containing protein [Bordetella genomosp. 5]OZI47263.1 hypothetical protein CEK29_00440 [Bordetella genomosp. 5]OZI55198.1 hypothetical protein CAL25_01930 [Bordetella genomosp. 5]
MNTPSAGSSGPGPRRGLHPLFAAAAVAVIVLCTVAVAAILGWLPTPGAQQRPGDAPMSAEQAANSGPEAANLAPADPGAVPAARAQNGLPSHVAQGQAQPAPAQPAPQARQPASCPSCGTVASIRTVQVPVRDNSNHIVGTVAGGVVGGVVGNQFGGGHGKDALTVLGAVGGALAGREVERNIRQQQTVTHYEAVVRMDDGSQRTFRSAQPFAFATGAPVRVENDQLLPR